MKNAHLRRSTWAFLLSPGKVDVKILLATVLGAVLLLATAPVFAGEKGDYAPDRFGGAVAFGHAYDPDAVDFLLLSGFALFDYDRVWPHRAPDALRFKVEGSFGASTRPRTRTMAAAGMLALYYLDRLATARLRPYAEAGIGLIYTDFRVSGQAWRLNFNPQAGIGTEIKAGDGPPWFTAFRLHHLSNGGLHRDNRGINSVVLQAGRFF